MNAIEKIRNGEDGIVVFGNQPDIIQAIFDFDFLAGKSRPSVVAIVTAHKRMEKFLFGLEQIPIPCVPHITALPRRLTKSVRFGLNLQSGRRAVESSLQFFKAFPRAIGLHIFAEDVPERHAIHLGNLFGKRKLIVGPSGVGLLVPGKVKLGAIGGIDLNQFSRPIALTPGAVALISTSGGMTNEILRSLEKAGKRISFAVSIGGERFPPTSLKEVLLLAQKDAQTLSVVYFGELGGEDEYEVAELIKSGLFTKPLVAYIAGTVGEHFAEPTQFGHAKSLVLGQDESAQAKRLALASAGAVVPKTYPDLLRELAKLPQPAFTDVMKRKIETQRMKSLLSTRKILESDDTQRIFVKNRRLVKPVSHPLEKRILEALLGGRTRSEVTPAFVSAIFEMLLDHGGGVSGAVNTIITARAGKDLVASLCAGLLTVGPRFGGAINDAAKGWLEAVAHAQTPDTFVENERLEGRPLPGIGHLKYHLGNPDPRVEALSQFASLMKHHPYYDFARAVEKITSAKKSSLIVNIDGIVAALLLDVLSECEGFSVERLRDLVRSEFFNAFFVLPRSIGFIGHFLEQKLNDEGLFRLPDELIFVRNERDKDRRLA